VVEVVILDQGGFGRHDTDKGINQEFCSSILCQKNLMF
jgi:hypothetical protein